MAQFRDPTLVKKVITHIQNIAPPYKVKICHVCGTHEWTINHYGLRALLPETVDIVAGPGCPVCVVPSTAIDEAIWLALEGVVVATYGDMFRVPSTHMSLQDAKALGGNVKIVYSISDVTKMAKLEPGKDFVFFAIGFETTTPTTAIEILKPPPKNLSFLVAHRLIPPAMELLLGLGDIQIDGFVAPGHVSTIIGLPPYQVFPEAYHVPTVVAGFEPVDVLFAIAMLLEQIRRGIARLENEYTRSVEWNGNPKAQELMNTVFDVVHGRWRGIGRLPLSALQLRDEFSEYDARKRYEIKTSPSEDILPGCSCHLVLTGRIQPPECALYRKQCTPTSPHGPCMVSNEGTCHIWYKYGGRKRL